MVPRRRPRLALLALLAGALGAAPAGVQAGAQAGARGESPIGPPSLSWEPARPTQGTLFTVRLDGTDAAWAVAGRFAGEPLHFRTSPGGIRWAVAAVPVDATDALDLVVDLAPESGSLEPLRARVPIAPGSYRMERLTVAPRYGAPLSPDLARRTADEAARAYAVARGAHDRAPLAIPSDFAPPRPTRVTSPFGGGREFNGRVESRHTGTDFQGRVGDPVLAAAPGVVALVGSFYLGGNVVYLDHGGGLSTGYLHLSETRVAVGDTVAAGERIGSVGATGRVTGPHLHWILRYGGITVDPLSVFDLAPPP